MNHTPEPWKVSGRAVYSGDDKYRIADCFGGGLEFIQEWSNAERIGACVNACAGIANPAAVPDAIDVLREMLAAWWGYDLTMPDTGIRLKAIRILDKLDAADEP